MTSEDLNIICVEKGNEISRIIRTVYGSLRYLMETVDGGASVKDILKGRAAHLLVIDQSVQEVDTLALLKILRTNPPLYIILIGEAKIELEQLPQERYVKQIPKKELIQKFPLLLSEIYKAFSRDIYSGLGFRKLLKESLYRMTGIIFLVRQDGRFVFANKAAEELLGVGDGFVLPDKITDILVDGTRSWNYISESCCNDQEHVNSFLLKFFNHRQEEVVKTVEVQTIEVEKPYYLLREKLIAHTDAMQQKSMELKLLDKFAESVANELLNPVNVLAGRLQLLDGTLRAEKREIKNLDAIKRQVARIEEIVGKLLTFARLKQDYIPQRIALNELLKNVMLEPSIQRLTQGDIKLDIEDKDKNAVLNGQTAQFDLLIKTLLEISFNALGSKGRVTAWAGLEPKFVFLALRLEYSHKLYPDMLSLKSYLAENGDHGSKNSIESTIILQIIQQYDGTYELNHPETDVEELHIRFPLIQSIN